MSFFNDSKQPHKEIPSLIKSCLHLMIYSKDESMVIQAQLIDELPYAPRSGDKIGYPEGDPVVFDLPESTINVLYEDLLSGGWVFTVETVGFSLRTQVLHVKLEDITRKIDEDEREFKLLKTKYEELGWNVHLIHRDFQEFTDLS